MHNPNNHVLNDNAAYSWKVRHPHVRSRKTKAGRKDLIDVITASREDGLPRFGTRDEVT